MSAPMQISPVASPSTPPLSSMPSSSVELPPSAALSVDAPAGAPVTSSSSSSAPSSALTAAAVSQLIEDLRNNDLQIRLKAFKEIPSIARALGPQRSRDELIPYLNEFVDDDDEVLIVLAAELANLIPLLGGSAHCFVLLPPLEHLSATEESSVRDRAVKSLELIVSAMDEPAVEEYVLPLVKKLAQAEWFTSRISAAALFHPIYNRVKDAAKKDLRGLFAKLCADETPMVRRAACSNLGQFCSVLDYASVKADLFVPFSKLAKDDQDSVRLLTVAAAIPIAKAFKPADNITKMLPMIFSLCSDKSWRVRYMVADKFCDLCIAMGAQESKSDDLLDSFVRLLQDDESEVRTAAAFKVGEVAKLVGPAQTVKKLLAPLKLLVKDQSQFTRAALGSTIMSIASVIKKKETFDHLVPLFLILLKDPSSEVRLNIISKLESINEVMSMEMLSQSLLPAICELAQDPKWRIRLQIIQHIPVLAQQLGHEFFDAKLADLCMNWLGDQVYSIREAATANLTRLAEVFGVEWAKLNILPKVVNLASHKSYLFRMTSVFAIKDLAKIVGIPLTQTQFLPVLTKLCQDPVPNVRFNCLRTLTSVISKGELGPRQGIAALDGQLVPTLQKLALDADSDVKYHANQCLTELMKKD